VDYIISLILPPLGVWRSGFKPQLIVSLGIWILALIFFYVAANDGPPGTYAAGPVIYMFAVIHSFVLTHRKLQAERGSIHPHQDQ